MARIPDAVVARLKRQVSLPRLVTAAGVEIVEGRRGEWAGSCPFHPDGDGAAGLVVSSKANSWRCSAGCGGSVVDWVMRAEGVSFRHAVELLRDGHVPSRLDRPPPERSSVTRLDAAAFSAELSDGELLEAVLGFYGDTLKANVDAQGWLGSRRCGTGEAIDVFRLGFCDRSLGYRIPAANRAEGKAIRDRLKGLGVLRESGHERFRGSLVVPVRDVEGRIVQVYGRKTGTGLRKGTELHSWLHDGGGWVFNEASFGAADELIVCEGLVDALTLWCAGLRNVTGLAGPDGWGDEHSAALERHGVSRVLIGFDNDAEGNAGAEALTERLRGEGIEVFRLHLPEGADINDVAVAASDPADTLAGLVRRAEWAGTGTGTAPPRSLELFPSPPAGSSPATETSTVDRDVEGDNEGVSPLADTSPELTVSPIPAPPTAGPQVELVDGQAVIVFAQRRWRLRGLEKNTSFDVLRANVLVSIEDRFHVDTLDLYSARARATFVVQAAGELRVSEDVVKRDLGRVLLAAEGLVEEAIHDAQTPEQTIIELDADEKAAALELLTSPDLTGRIVADFERVGVVGEATNLLVGYLAATSRLLARPLAVIVQSTSAAGKSQLMDAVLSFVPPEDLVRFSAMTGQSLYYLGESDLAHKVLAIAEEEGAERAAYALKLLQSEGELSIASTGKDNASGRLVTHEYSVRGPTGIFLTTTAIDVDEELLNRCLVLSVDEDRAQTRAIHVQQRRAHTLDGLLAKTRASELVGLHRNAQRLLEPLAVVNPFADRLGFADAATRTRRDHVKYLTLISAIALLHQHQRPKRTATIDGAAVTYIEASADDIELANSLAADVLGRSLDELPPQTRRLLDLLWEMVTAIAEEAAVLAADVRFTRRQARERLGWGDTQLKVHLGRLADMEFLVVHRPAGPGPFTFELAWAPPEPGAGSRFLPGLVTIDTQDPGSCGYDEGRSGSATDRSGSGRGCVGPQSGPGRPTTESLFAQQHNEDGTSGGADGLNDASGAGGEDVVVVEPAAVEAS
jgi:Toprim-like/CHC2 zinc finger